MVSNYAHTKGTLPRRSAPTFSFFFAGSDSAMRSSGQWTTIRNAEGLGEICRPPQVQTFPASPCWCVTCRLSVLHSLQICSTYSQAFRLPGAASLCWPCRSGASAVKRLQVPDAPSPLQMQGSSLFLRTMKSVTFKFLKEWLP